MNLKKQLILSIFLAIFFLPLNLLAYSSKDLESLNSYVKLTESIDPVGNVLDKNQVIRFTSYYEINDKNLSYFLSNGSYLKSECLLKVSSKNAYWITKGGCEVRQLYSLQEVIDKKLSLGVFEINDPLIGLDKNNNYFVYSLNKTYYTSEPLDINSKLQDFIVKDNLIIKEGTVYKIIKSNQFEKIEMFSKDLLEKEYPELNNKESLKVLALMFLNYKDYINNDFLPVLKEIKVKSLELTNGKRYDEDKILAIYDWILNNIKYDPETNKYLNGEITIEQLNKVSSLRVQTPIGTFKDKLGVCEGIASLLHLMVQFSGITGNEYEIGGVFSEKYTLHAWNKIGNYYFDATYDLNSRNKSFYKLPKDLFYTNRDLNVSHEELRNKIGKDFENNFKENLIKFKSQNPSANYSLSNSVNPLTLEQAKNIFGMILDMNKYGQFKDANGNKNRFSVIQSYNFKTEKELLEFANLYTNSPKKFALGTRYGKYLFIDLLNSITETSLYKGGKTDGINYDNLVKTKNSFSLPNKQIILSNDSYTATIQNNISTSNSQLIEKKETVAKEIIKEKSYPIWYIYKGAKLKNGLNSSISLVKIENNKSIKIYTLPNNLLILNKKLLGELTDKELEVVFEKLIVKGDVIGIGSLSYNINEKIVNTELKMQKLSSIYFRNNLFNDKLTFKDLKDLKDITLTDINLELKSNFTLKKANNKKGYVYNKGETNLYKELNTLIK